MSLILKGTAPPIPPNFIMVPHMSVTKIMARIRPGKKGIWNTIYYSDETGIAESKINKYIAEELIAKMNLSYKGYVGIILTMNSLKLTRAIIACWMKNEK